MRIAQSPRITPYGFGDPETWGGRHPDCDDIDEAAIESVAAHIWDTEISTPFNGAEVSEALGEMTSEQWDELAELMASDPMQAQLFIGRKVHDYWETWARNKAMEKLKNEY